MASLHLAQEIFKLIYPVGSIYLSTSTTNPSTYFGGTWEQVAKEQYLIGYNASNAWFNRPGQNKGSSSGPGSWNTNNHTLTINEIPSHQHAIMRGTEGNSYFGITGKEPNGGSPYQMMTSAVGGGQGHNHFHVSPYYIVVVWRRTA